MANSSGQEGKVGFLIGLLTMVVVFALLLPLIGMIYFDTLTTKEQAKQQYEKVEKLRKKVEDERRQVESERHSQ